MPEPTLTANRTHYNWQPFKEGARAQICGPCCLLATARSPQTSPESHEPTRTRQWLSVAPARRRPVGPSPVGIAYTSLSGGNAMFFGVGHLSALITCSP